MIDRFEDVPSALLHYSLNAVLQLFGVGALVAFFGALTYYALNATPPMPELSIAAAVLVLVGIGAGITVIIAVKRAFRIAREYFDFERQRIQRDQEALLREREPRAVAAAKGPDEGLAVSQGVEITYVSNLIDKRDLFYFCTQIAATKDWTARRWEGITLPYGYKISNKDTSGIGEATSYRKLMALFTGCKPPLLVDRGEGKTGTLTETDPNKMVARILGYGVAK